MDGSVIQHPLSGTTRMGGRSPYNQPAPVIVKVYVQLRAPFVEPDYSSVLQLEVMKPYRVVVSGDGAWVEDSTGKRYLDAMSGGSMAATLGHGRRDLIDLVWEQSRRIGYLDNNRLTNPWQEALAAKLVTLAPPGLSRARFATGGSEANEAAIRAARMFHVARGEPSRWQIISPAQSYHGPTMQTLALTGRPGLHGAFGPYLSRHRHIPPATRRFDPTGRQALDALDEALEQVGPENVSAFFCEPISAASLPAYSPPELFWEGLAERREQHGFLVCFDEVVTGVGRTGAWFAANNLPIVPDIIATAKGLGAGYVAIGAVLYADRVYEAIAASTEAFTLGHTWDGSPLPCAIGLSVLGILESEGWVDHVAVRGPSLRDELAEALAGNDLVGEVRGRGYLLGIDYVDPRDGVSFLPPELGVAGRIERAASRNGLLVLGTMPTRDGFAGDQHLFAPPFTTPESDLEAMVERMTTAVSEVASEVRRELGSTRSSGSRRSVLRALIVQHEAPTPAGLVREWLDDRGVEVETYRIDLDDRRIDPTRYDLIVSLGSEFAAFDDSIPWIDREKDLLIEAYGADVPILGLCFGGQLLARVLGGDSYRGEMSEVGWLPVRSRDEDLIPRGPWFQWHFDTFSVPPGGELIADSEAGPQAFVAGRSLGVQFHPEVTNEIMDGWVSVYRHELDAEGVDPDELLQETKDLAVSSRAVAIQLLERFTSDIAGLALPRPV